MQVFLFDCMNILGTIALWDVLGYANRVGLLAVVLLDMLVRSFLVGATAK